MNEDELHALLACHSNDQAMLELAVLHEIAGDPRGAGYRALVHLHVACRYCRVGEEEDWRWGFTRDDSPQISDPPDPMGYVRYALPADWFAAVPAGIPYAHQRRYPEMWTFRASARVLLDDAATAFATLTPARRAEIMSLTRP